MSKAALLPSGQDVGWAWAVPCVPSEIRAHLCGGSEWSASLFLTPVVSFNPESLLDWTFRVLLPHFFEFSQRGKKSHVTYSRYTESCGSADALRGTKRWCSTWVQQAPARASQHVRAAPQALCLLFSAALLRSDVSGLHMNMWIISAAPGLQSLSDTCRIYCLFYIECICDGCSCGTHITWSCEVYIYYDQLTCVT